MKSLSEWLSFIKKNKIVQIDLRYRPHHTK